VTPTEGWAERMGDRLCVSSQWALMLIDLLVDDEGSSRRDHLFEVPLELWLLIKGVAPGTEGHIQGWAKLGSSIGK
jgi:hypothetical protein